MDSVQIEKPCRRTWTVDRHLLVIHLTAGPRFGPPDPNKKAAVEGRHDRLGNCPQRGEDGATIQHPDSSTKIHQHPDVIHNRARP